MKKLKKNQLKLDKEVITSLTENDLSFVRGGEGGPIIVNPTNTISANGCTLTQPSIEALTKCCETKRCFERVTAKNCPDPTSQDGAYSCPSGQSICFVCL